MDNSHHIKGILFDKDGTLFDYAATWMPLNHRAALHAARGDQDLANDLLLMGGWLPDQNTVSAGSLLAAHTNLEIAEAWNEHLGGDWDTQELYQDITEMWNTHGSDSATPVTDLPHYLNGLRELGYILGVATSDNETSARAMLSRFNAETPFDFIAGYNSGHGTKPGPGMAHAFCKQTNLELSEVVMVGDNAHDIEMADNAKVAFAIGVLTGTSSRADLERLTPYVLDDITGIPALLTKLAS